MYLILSIAEFRLVDGSNNCQGILEIGHSSVFKKACTDTKCGENEAMVICRDLGCTATGAQRVDTNM